MEAELLKRSLHRFVKAAWHVVEPKTPFVDNWHIAVICEHLEALYRSEIQFLVINVPPGTMKSLLVNVFAPAWAWANWPEKRMAFAAGSDGLETRDSLKCIYIVPKTIAEAKKKILKEIGDTVIYADLVSAFGADDGGGGAPRVQLGERARRGFPERL